MAKKQLKKAQPGTTFTDPMPMLSAAQRANMAIANKAALEKVNAPAVKPYDMDTMYAASKAAADSTYKSDLEALRLQVQKREQERVNAERARRLDAMTTPNKKAGGATTRPITDLGMVDRMEKAKFLKGKKKK